MSSIFCAHATRAAGRSCRTDLEDALDHTRQSAAVKKELIDIERDFIYQLLREGQDYRRGAPSHRV
jgi:hypothetical protein